MKQNAKPEAQNLRHLSRRSFSGGWIAAFILQLSALSLSSSAGTLTIVSQYGLDVDGFRSSANKTMSIPVADTNFISAVVIVSTNPTVFSLSPLRTNCYLYVNNLTGTATNNWIRFGADGTTETNYPFVLKAGQAITTGFWGTNVVLICQTNTTRARIIAIPQQ